jgi:hypothetical protein
LLNQRNSFPTWIKRMCFPFSLVIHCNCIGSAERGVCLYMMKNDKEIWLENRYIAREKIHFSAFMCCPPRIRATIRTIVIFPLRKDTQFFFRFSIKQNDSNCCVCCTCAVCYAVCWHSVGPL